MIRLCAFSDEAGAPLAEQIAGLTRNGVFLTELRSVDGVNIANITEERAKEIRAELERNGIGVWSVGSPFGKVSLEKDFSEEALWKELRHLCRLAQIFACDKIRVFSFYDAYSHKEQVFALLTEAVKIAAEYGVTLYHENEKKIYGDVPARVRELREAVPGLKFIYDPANYLQCGCTAEETLPLAAFAGYFHIKDVIAAEGTLVPAGEGDGAIPRLIAGIGADTVLTVEPHLAIFKGYAEIDGEEMKNKYQFRSNAEAFDAAVTALKKVLARGGYRETEGGAFSK